MDGAARAASKCSTAKAVEPCQDFPPAKNMFRKCSEREFALFVCAFIPRMAPVRSLTSESEDRPTRETAYGDEKACDCGRENIHRCDDACAPTRPTVRGWRRTGSAQRCMAVAA